MARRQEPLHCCPSRYTSRETACFCLLGILIAVYMLAGAAIFSSLEGPAEARAHQLWERRLKDFSQNHTISPENLRSFLCYYEEARAAGVRPERRRALWDFPGSFYFVGTVVSTIGFGTTAPSTTMGKLLLVFYGLLGCSATLLFFNLFLERIVTLLGLVISWCHRRSKQDNASLKTSPSRREERKAEEWKPPVCYVTLILLAAVMVVACGAATLYSEMEGWSYLESLYFCFVAFSTVGFGDFVSSQREYHEDSQGYQVANCLLLLLGVSCTYSFFNSISIIIRQCLNWILRTLFWMYGCVCKCRSRQWQLFCFSDSDIMCFCREDTLHRRQIKTASSLGCDIQMPSCVTDSICICLSNGQMETTSHKAADGGIAIKQLQGHCLPGVNALCVPPLSTS